MEFKTNKRIDKWTENHIKQCFAPHSIACERFAYEFLQSGLVERQTVKCLWCKEEFVDCDWILYDNYREARD